MSFSPDAAEAFAIKAFTWLAANEELLPVFLGSTGVSVQDIKERAGDPVFLGSVLDFIMMDDRWVIAFCDDLSLEYSSPMAARQALPGGEQTHWT